ncbi:MAG TPA: hypothetical protein VL625_00275 [Patescibacteria group bacterium]|nr:hypothetical protein [Patescibacteria group bacterium]
MDPALKICRPSLVTAFNDNAIWGDPRARKANCYAYALNCPDMGTAVPGQLTIAEPKISLETVTVPDFRELLTKKDGLVEISREDALSGKFHAIALRIAFHEDCHFYRRDPIGIWSYKNGDREISRFDEQGGMIDDPQEITDRRYTQFGGYYAIPEGGILYLPR